MKVSVILPTLNESGNIVSLIRNILSQLDGYEAEVIVADDNSPDHTCEIVQQAFAGDHRIRTLLRRENPGLANSIRDGIQLATGEQILVMDSDGTHDPVEIPRLLHVSRVYDIVIGSRFAPGGNMQDRPHYFSSMAYNFLVRIILSTQIQDNLGGYFTMRREKLLRLDFDHIFEGFGEYFFRLLHDAQNLRYTVVEIPAQFVIRESGISKSNFFRMIFNYTRAALKVRFSDNFRLNRIALKTKAEAQANLAKATSCLP